MGHLAAIPLPQPVLQPLIKLYSFGFGVDTEEIQLPPDGFASFGDFFARKLRPEARPFPEEFDRFTSPCDGKLTAFGEIRTDEDPLFEVKGERYLLKSLLGSEEESRSFEGGGFAVIYLHPRDYHRVHAPATLHLAKTRHIPGARFSVASWCERWADGVYDKNERVVFHGRFPEGGALSVVMVAAFGVGNIVTSFHPGFSSKGNVCWERAFEPPSTLARGEELGAFRLGSTVVMVWSKGAVTLDDELETGPMQLGLPLGKVLSATT